MRNYSIYPCRAIVENERKNVGINVIKWLNSLIRTLEDIEHRVVFEIYTFH